jgi:hypothetical protein
VSRELWVQRDPPTHRTIAEEVCFHLGEIQRGPLLGLRLGGRGSDRQRAARAWGSAGTEAARCHVATAGAPGAAPASPTRGGVR